MTDQHTALQEAERLSQLSQEALIEELGIRVVAADEQASAPIAQAFNGDFAAKVPDMSATSFLVSVGTRWWAKLEPQLMAILCSPGNEDLKTLTGNKSIPQMAAGLATAGVMAAIAAPPAWIIVATTILATKLADSGLQALCETWAEERKT